jgi:hypothetical protein
MHSSPQLSPAKTSHRALLPFSPLDLLIIVNEERFSAKNYTISRRISTATLRTLLTPLMSCGEKKRGRHLPEESSSVTTNTPPIATFWAMPKAKRAASYISTPKTPAS